MQKTNKEQNMGNYKILIIISVFIIGVLITLLILTLSGQELRDEKIKTNILKQQTIQKKGELAEKIIKTCGETFDACSNVCLRISDYTNKVFCVQNCQLNLYECMRLAEA